MMDKIRENKVVIALIAGLLIILLGLVIVFIISNSEDQPQEETLDTHETHNHIESTEEATPITARALKTELFEQFDSSTWNMIETTSKTIELYEDDSSINEEDIEENLSDRQYYLIKQYHFTLNPVVSTIYGDETLEINCSISFRNNNKDPQDLTLAISYSDETLLDDLTSKCYQIIKSLYGEELRDSVRALSATGYSEEELEVNSIKYKVCKSASDMTFTQGHMQYSMSIENEDIQSEYVQDLGNYFSTSNEDTGFENIAIYNIGDSIQRIESRIANLYSLNTTAKFRYLYEDTYSINNIDYKQMTAILDTRTSDNYRNEVSISTISKTPQNSDETKEYLRVSFGYTNTSVVYNLYNIESMLETLLGTHVELDTYIANSSVNLEIDEDRFGFPLMLEITYDTSESGLVTANVVLESVDKSATEIELAPTYNSEHNVDENGNQLTENGFISITEDEIDPFAALHNMADYYGWDTEEMLED